MWKPSIKVKSKQVQVQVQVYLEPNITVYSLKGLYRPQQSNQNMTAPPDLILMAGKKKLPKNPRGKWENGRNLEEDHRERRPLLGQTGVQ